MPDKNSLANNWEMDFDRESINNIKRASDEILYDYYDVDSEESFRLSYLRKQFTFKGLDELFNRYVERIDHTYFSTFLILQAFLSFTHFVLVLVINAETNTLFVVVPDLTLYSVTGLLSLITLYLNEGFVKIKSRVIKCFKLLIFFLIVASDLVIPIYCNLSSRETHLRPAYLAHILIATYCFFGIVSDLQVLLVGIVVTTGHLLTLAFVTYFGSLSFWTRLGSDIIFAICLNCLGFYYRWTSELIKRRSFLDHRACVELTLKLKFEKEQEEHLMTSIIPEHTIDKVRKDILDKIEILSKMGHLPISDPMDIPYVQEYDNVTILYADIVNYTAMSTKLPVITLVDTLNELFSGFDDASEKLNVMRIKFLGDCYYSVAGLPPNPAPNHAEACVDLGLQMISIIRSVRERRKLSIDMRIGVHTGKILSGLIGSTKWQFDIWSKDVFLANKMETAGKPGQIHITKQTYDLLTKTSYNIKPSHRGKTSPHLQGYNVQTYFVKPDFFDCVELTRTQTNEVKHKLSIINEHNSNNTILLDDILRNSVTSEVVTNPSVMSRSFSLDELTLRNSSSEPNFQSIQPSTFASRRGSLKNMSPRSRSSLVTGRRVTPRDIKRRTAFMDNNINKYKLLLAQTQENIKKAIDDMPLSKYNQWNNKDLNPFFLTFRTWKMEKNYIKLADYLFKFYLLMYVFMEVVIVSIQNLNVPRWEWSLWIHFIIVSIVVLVIIPLTWFRPIWKKNWCDYKMTDEDSITKPQNGDFHCLCTISKAITDCVIIRTTTYVVLCGFCLYCVFGELTKCILHVITPSGLDHGQCIIPSYIVHTLSLALLMSFSFTRIHVGLKLGFMVFVVTFYGVLLWNLPYSYIEDTDTFNYMMSPKISDMVTLIFLAVALHLLDRQNDYLNRLDFQWTEKLVVEQTEMHNMSKITKMLLQNILPAHVAHLYLDVNRKNNVLYNEEYENVAVIFASVTDSPIDIVSEKYFLGIVNRIIKDFDNVLRKERKNSIEKIKVTNLTYMAACGLDPDRTETSDQEGEHVAVTLIKFAVDLIKALKKINGNILECKLRVGISHGKVMGGVVGSKKPLYDIWSDTVNMASRMDSTGIAGKIQVTENTARVLQEYGIQCEFRDYVIVKGKENRVATYFVALDDDHNLVKESKNTKL